MDQEARGAEIDDGLYSRQRYVLGDSAMQKLAQANVFISALGGVGVEIAKDVILAGVKSVTLHDFLDASPKDLGTQFFLREADIGKNRASASVLPLAALNPHVTVSSMCENFLENLELLKQFQVVVFSEHKLDDLIRVNEFCRRQNPPIYFVYADVFGVMSWLFCDFGDKFIVSDADGEEPREIFIESVTKGSPAVVTCLDYRRHGLETGDTVTFSEVNGMTQLNGESFPIKYLSPFSFYIDCDTTPVHFGNYTHGGVARKKKLTVAIEFQSLGWQLESPTLTTVDLSKIDNPLQVFFCIYALKLRLSETGTRGFENGSLDLVKYVNKVSTPKQVAIDYKIIECLSRTYGGQLSPLCAAIGGIAAQEVLKSVTGKFSPLRQWLVLDAMEVALEGSCPGEVCVGRDFSIRTCVGLELSEKLKKLRLFMVGCGAIGCEMMKNFALLGVATDEGGLITVTDNDLIERSNLNRQFLFRPWHIQKSKSVVAAEATKEINPSCRIHAQQNKVCPDTEATIFNDAFFLDQNVIVNALDNVEARRYVDSRCVTNQRALLETGTMGAKGHVQVIVPHLTESYANQRDPADEDVPYCTLKSFPQVIEHTIQWARDKFETVFARKAATFNKFWETNGKPEDLAKTLSKSGAVPDGFVPSVRVLQRRPRSWGACVELARWKFERYFNHSAKLLLHLFPRDSKLSDGSWFWQSPKRPPSPLVFSAKDETHMLFIVSYAKLLARINDIVFSVKDLEPATVEAILSGAPIPIFAPSSKKIDTDESKTGAPDQSDQVDVSKVDALIDFLQSSPGNLDTTPLRPEHFEKDDDSNSHVDFITAASNLRAVMYGIETADRYKTKRIAGRIIPAIATTTAAIAGLASIELLKVVARQPVESLKNCFLNLALPLIVLSEPGHPPRVHITEDMSFTCWDRWEVYGHKNYLLSHFIAHFQEKYKLVVSMVCQGVKMIYVPVMPGHAKRVNETMLKLIKPGPGMAYVDLIIGFDPCDLNAEEDLPAPPVRYYFN